MEFALFGIGPAMTDRAYPTLVHKAEDTMNGLNPLDVVVILLAGLKMPMLYRITATMTMIRIAQPYQ